MTLLRPALLLVVLALVACSTPEAIPDFRYYRLAPPSVPERLPQLLLDRPLVLEAFRADGVHGERPMLYATDPDSLRITQYHYQLWNDPPPVMVQRRMLRWLADRGVSALVTDRLSNRVSSYRLRGSIYRFERVLSQGVATEVVVGLRLRVDADGESLPRLELDELVRIPVNGGRVEDSSLALSQGIDQISERLVRALQTAVDFQ